MPVEPHPQRDDNFSPPFYLKSAVTQTLLASSRIRVIGSNAVLDAAKEIILNPVGDVRLQGFYSKQPNGNCKGLVILLHGWEGSANSTYIRGTGSFLYENGYSVFRLNYRDHGDSQHLNPGLFYAVLLDEVFYAVKQVSEYEPGLPFYLAGFSLGGNFTLRIACKCADIPIDNLSHIVSISPALDPEKSTYAIDHVPLLRHYFRKKWQHSLQKKQVCFPDLYDFSEILLLDSIADMTDVMLERYSNFESASLYFRSYAVMKNALVDVPVPTTIITAKDDPIIPVDDFYDLKLNSLIDLIIHCYGGHNGFLENLSGRAWYEQKMLEIFK